MANYIQENSIEWDLNEIYEEVKIVLHNVWMNIERTFEEYPDNTTNNMQRTDIESLNKVNNNSNHDKERSIVLRLLKKRAKGLIIDNNSCNISLIFKNKESVKPELRYENFHTEFISRPKKLNAENNIDVLGRRTYETRNALILNNKTSYTSEKSKDLLFKSYKTKIVPYESKLDIRACDKKDENGPFPMISKYLKEKKRNFFKNFVRKNCFSEMKYEQYNKKNAQSLNKNFFKWIHKLSNLKTPNKLSWKNNAISNGKRRFVINSLRNINLIDSMKSVKSPLKKIHHKKNRTLIHKEKLIYYQTSYDAEIDGEVDWSLSQLYTAALRSDLCFNSKRNAAHFKEEEVSKVLSNVSQLNYIMMQVYFKKARNSIRKIFMEMMHPEYYSAIKAACNNSEDLIDVLRCLEDLIDLRRELLLLFMQIIERKVLFTLIYRI